jgi:hypothetical protein
MWDFVSQIKETKYVEGCLRKGAEENIIGLKWDRVSGR